MYTSWILLWSKFNPIRKFTHIDWVNLLPQKYFNFYNWSSKLYVYGRSSTLTFVLIFVGC